MGAAKLRGTFEQRKALAIEAARLETERREADRIHWHKAKSRVSADIQAMGLAPDDDHTVITRRSSSGYRRNITTLHAALALGMFFLPPHR